MSATAIVIDDDPNVITALSDLLKTLDVKIIGTSSTAQEAITEYVKKLPDLVFTDLTLENSNGFFIIKTIQKISNYAKIIVVTGDVSIRTKQELEKLGITTIVYKPFSSDDIKDAIKKELE